MIDESLLDDALSRRTKSLEAEVNELVRLADLAGHLPFPGPDIPARVRMTTRFDEYITGRSKPGVGAWIAGWVGAGPRPRTAAQRLAAGGAILLASASGASAATGQTPASVATSVASFASNVVHNLGPRTDDAAGPLTTSSSTPSPTATLTPTPTPTAPTPTAPNSTATGTSTPPVPQSAATTAPSGGQAPSNDGGSSEGHSPGEAPSATPTPPPPGVTPTTTVARQGIYPAGDGGTVQLSFDDSSLTVLSVQANPGWKFSIKLAHGQSVEVTFDNSDRRLTFDATLESGQPAVHMRTTIAAPESTRLPLPTVTRIPSPTPTRSHEGDEHSLEDSSGPSPTPVVASP